jgi:phosphohistidine phosphatase
MRLYLVQHGDALPKKVDPERPLSERGRSDVEQLAAFIGRVGIRVARVAHSGKTRARQTAELLAATVTSSGEIEARGGMDPLDPTDALAKEAQTWNEDVMLVGHLPFMGKLVARLIGQGEDSDVVAFQPGSGVCLERKEEGGWALVWMIRPDLLPAD